MERRNGDNGSERFISFFAEDTTAVAERDAFAAALDYVTTPADAGIYYYSKYERTSYRKLQQKHPDVCTPEDVEQLFSPTRAIDFVRRRGLEGDRMAHQRSFHQDSGSTSGVRMA